MDDDDDEDEEIVGSLLSSLENILLRGTNVSHDKMRNQSEKDHLLSRHTSLATETFESAGRRGYLSGHLTKLGHVYKTWRRRFFILNDTKRLLFYYDDAKMGCVKGVIELEGADVLRDVTRGKELCFQISYPRHPLKRRYLLYAENQRDLQLWLKALNHVAQHDSPVPRPAPSSPPPHAEARVGLTAGSRRMRSGRSTSLSPSSSPAPPVDHLRRSRSVSAAPSSSATQCDEDAATQLRPSSSSFSPSSSSPEPQSPTPSPLSTSPRSITSSLLSALSASSTTLPEALSFLLPDSPASRRASLPILPSQHYPTPVTHLRSLLNAFSFSSSRSWTLLPSASTTQSSSAALPVSPPCVQDLHQAADKAENGGEQQAFTEGAAPHNEQTISHYMTTIAVHVDASLQTQSVALVHDEQTVECSHTSTADNSGPAEQWQQDGLDNLALQSSATPAASFVDGQLEEEVEPTPAPELQQEQEHEEGNETDGVDEEQYDKQEEEASTAEDWSARFQWLIEENRAKVLAQVEPHGAETAGWTLIKEEGNILVSRKEMQSSSLVMTRAEGRIRASAARVLHLISSFRYDPLVISCERVRKLTKGVDIAYLQARSPFPFISNRDFVLLRSTHQDPETGTYLSCATSIPELPSSALPLAQGAEVFVRGEVLNSGWAIEPFDDGDDASYRDRDGADEMSSAPEEDNREEVYCTYVVCVDLRGLVPNWVVNMFQARDVHAAFAQLKQQAEDQRGHAAAAANAPPSSPTATATLEMT